MMNGNINHMYLQIMINYMIFFRDVSYSSSPVDIYIQTFYLQRVSSWWTINVEPFYAAPINDINNICVIEVSDIQVCHIAWP